MNAHKIKWDEDELVQAEEDITLNYERIKIKKKKKNDSKREESSLVKKESKLFIL